MASLTSKLFSKPDAADAGLDSIFKSSAGSSYNPPRPAPPVVKRSAESPGVNSRGSKRVKPAFVQLSNPSKRSKPIVKASEVAEDSDSAGSAIAGDANAPPVHETLTGESVKSSRRSKTKYIPPGETPQQVDARTVFVGNLPSEMLKNKAATKALIRHLTSQLDLPALAKIESTRFRSIPFSKSTKSLKEGEEDPEEAEAEEDGDDEEDEDDANTGYRRRKRIYSTAQKKRLAFLKGDIHDKADAVNCYVVFGHTRPKTKSTSDSEGSQAEEEPTPTSMSPYEIARKVISTANSTIFMERTIRVDYVGSAKVSTPLTAEAGSNAKEEMKRTVFVGSLDFAATDDGLREFLENVVKVEKGDPPDGKGWVEMVRIVRDADSQVGKGIAYARFRDVDCVDEILALRGDQLAFNKRKMRLQRCKTLPRLPSSTSPSKPKTPTSSTPTSVVKKTFKPGWVEAPKGDPTLGVKLATMSKGERKEVKSSDADRVARRLAKKKMRAAMDEKKGAGGVKVQSGLGKPKKRSSKAGEKKKSKTAKK